MNPSCRLWPAPQCENPFNILKCKFGVIGLYFCHMCKHYIEHFDYDTRDAWYVFVSVYGWHCMRESRSVWVEFVKCKTVCELTFVCIDISTFGLVLQSTSLYRSYKSESPREIHLVFQFIRNQNQRPSQHSWALGLHIYIISLIILRLALFMGLYVHVFICALTSMLR